MKVAPMKLLNKSIMDKANFLYLIFLFNLIIMGYTIYRVYQREDYQRVKKLTFLYITIIAPILGLILVLMDRQRSSELK